MRPGALDALGGEGEAISIARFHPASDPGHRPVTQLWLGHDGEALLGVFRVEDRYVRSVVTQYNGMVCRDSCVELFVRPRTELAWGSSPRAGYFNFEFNCGGVLHASYITDHTRTPDGFAAFERIPEALGRLVEVRSSMPRVVEPEIAEPCRWELRFRLPQSVMEPYVGPLGDLGGQVWAANAYKCGDRTSHPHWASWMPLGEALNFHDPGLFGRLEFEAAPPSDAR